MDHISVFVGTFNMGDAAPPVSLDSWLKSSGLGKTLPAALSQAHDMYVFGTQVCTSLFTKCSGAFKLMSCCKYMYIYDVSLSFSLFPARYPSLPLSLSLHLSMQESSMTEKDWFIKLKTSLRVLYDIDYEKLAFQKLWGIQLLILVKPEHHKKITHLQVSQVRTGIGNALGKFDMSFEVPTYYVCTYVLLCQ